MKILTLTPLEQFKQILNKCLGNICPITSSNKYVSKNIYENSSFYNLCVAYLLNSFLSNDEIKNSDVGKDFKEAFLNLSYEKIDVIFQDWKKFAIEDQEIIKNLSASDMYDLLKFNISPQSLSSIKTQSNKIKQELFNFYKKHAEQGDARAKNNLENSFSWFKKPINQHTSFCYNNGIGLSKNSLNSVTNTKELAANLSTMLGSNTYRNKVVNNKIGYYKNVPFVHPEKLEARILEECLRAVALGEEKLAKALLEMRPKCLLENTVEVSKEFNIGNPIVAYSGKEFKNITPFQIALCEGDIAMAEMMIHFFKKLTKWEEQELPNGETKKVKLFDGEAEMQKQFEAIFPNGDVNKVMKQLKTSANNSKLIDNIFTAIENASYNEVNAILCKDYANSGELGNKFAEFVLEFEKLSKSETIFNPYHLIKAFQKYYDYYSFREMDINRNNLAWMRVVGYVQRYLPACLLQDFAYGLKDIVYEKFKRQNLPRALYPREENPHFMLSRSNSHGLGVDYAVADEPLRTLRVIPSPHGGLINTKTICHSVSVKFRKIILNKNFRLGRFTLQKPLTQTKSRSLGCMIS